MFLPRLPSPFSQPAHSAAQRQVIVPDDDRTQGSRSNILGSAHFTGGYFVASSDNVIGEVIILH